MSEMIKIELPAEEWAKMERHHEILEDFEFNVDIFGHGPAQTMLHKELETLLTSDKND